MKKGIFIFLSSVLILFSFFYFIEGSKAKIYDDVVITDVESENILLNNILKDNYLLIDTSFLKKSNNVELTLYNNSLKYNLYVSIECEKNDNYIIITDINHMFIKSHEYKKSSLNIEQVNNMDSEFIKCYLKEDKN